MFKFVKTILELLFIVAFLILYAILSDYFAQYSDFAKALFAFPVAAGIDVVKTIYTTLSSAIKREVAHIHTALYDLREENKRWYKVIDDRLQDVESESDLNKTNTQNIKDTLVMFSEGLQNSIASLKSSVTSLVEDRERTKVTETNRKEFSQRLKEQWLDIAHDLAEIDPLLVLFASGVYHKLEYFLLSVHKYDFTDVNDQAFTEDHKAVIDEIKSLAGMKAVPLDFYESYFQMLEKKSDKFNEKCRDNFHKRKLNAKRHVFETDAQQYLLILMDCAEMVWTSKTNKTEYCYATEVIK